MGGFSAQVIDVGSALFTREAAEQGGVLSGDNPAHYNASNPIRLWVIQVVLIIAMTQFLSLGLSRIRQPRVISEVLGGILLGPTVMGRIPGFKKNIFPDEGMPMLALSSNIGLIIFMFLVGLELDASIVKKNARASALVSVAGLVIPLGLGAVLGLGIYRKFVLPINPSVNEGYFLLFTAVAIGITAFPVLCRILTELKLLDDTVGAVTLSAGVGNDVVGWILLALTVALVNASTGLTALYVLLACVGYTIFLLFPVKWGFIWLARRTGSLEQGSPTPFMMTLTLLIVFISAFFTDIIGVHAIFGGFLAGLIIPHENGFAISVVEKLEDLVSILLIPIYFTLSGLKTNLGLLNDGITWGYTIIICLVAFVSKFAACGGMALLSGFKWREAGAIGSLMSCKGLVELIVLNIGLQANILDTRIFSMFVVHALILTFLTTPLTLWFYPSKYRLGKGELIARDPQRKPDTEVGGSTPSDNAPKTRFSIILDRIEQLPAAMTISQLLHPQGISPPPSYTEGASEKDSEAVSHADKDKRPTNQAPPSITIDALRLIELTDRTSAVLKSHEAENLLLTDPVLSVYRTFGNLNRLGVSAALSIVNFNEYAHVVANHARESDSHMVLLPWAQALSTTGDASASEAPSSSNNPFEGIFSSSTSSSSKVNSAVVYSEFIRSVFLNAPTDVALFMDRGMCTSATVSSSSRQHIFMPFFGGPDDRVTLSFIIQLCSKNTALRATVVRIRKVEGLALTRCSTSTTEAKIPPSRTPHATYLGPDTVYAPHDTHTRLASDTADNILWEQCINSKPPRISFEDVETPKLLATALDLLSQEQTKAAGKRLLAVVGRSRRLAVESHTAELQEILVKTSTSSIVPRTVGDVGAAIVAMNPSTSLLVVQARVSSA